MEREPSMQGCNGLLFILIIPEKGYYLSVRAFTPFPPEISSILRHSNAHLRHSASQRRQYSNSLELLSHSSAHELQISKHALQSNVAFSARILINLAAALHIMAHSRVSAIHLESISMLFSFRHSVAQRSHSPAHRLHASMQLPYS
jgi:hypothetical protein